jgi:hypothetical protein
MFGTAREIRRVQKHNFIATEYGARKLAINILEGFAVKDKGLFVVVLLKVQTVGRGEHN